MKIPGNINTFVSDVDDTLFSSELRLPGTENIKAFEEMHIKGFRIGIASGRPLWQGMRTHYAEWGLSFQFDFLIGTNGGELWNKRTDKTQNYHPLSPEKLKEIVLFMEQFPSINPFIYKEGMELSKYEDEEMIASSKRHDTKLVICEDISELWQQETGKILFRCPDTATASIAEAAGKEKFGNELACFKTNPTLVEIQDPRVNKGSALMAYCKEEGIDTENVIAFGDAENDIPLLQSAGWSVCLCNGMDNVKAITDDITEYPSGDSGVGRYLFNHIL